MTTETSRLLGLVMYADPSLFAAQAGRGTIVPTLGENRARRPVEYGVANIDDGLRYFRRLAARGEKDES